MTAGLILAVMITPIITSLSREVLATVAQDDKNAALGMGATRWEMLRVAVFPRVRGGIVGAVMLGLGRAMGETIAVALVIGSSRTDHDARVLLRRHDGGGHRERVRRGDRVRTAPRSSGSASCCSSSRSS